MAADAGEIQRDRWRPQCSILGGVIDATMQNGIQAAHGGTPGRREDSLEFLR
jgi:hypothetical protein